MTPAVLLAGVLAAILVFFLVLNSFQALLLACATPELWSHSRLGDDEYFQALIGSDALPPISAVAAVSGGEHDAVRLATMLLKLEYPRHEVVLVNDGATDRTFEVLTNELELYPVPPAFAISVPTGPVRGYYRSRTEPRLLVVDKERGGRADAMNAGLNAARYPHALTVGRNITFAPDALLRLTRPFLLHRNVVAVAGTLRPASGDAPGAAHGGRSGARALLRGLQTVEYLRNFLYQRLGWNRLASNLVFPGTAALVKREHVFAVGGFRRDVDAPSLDLVVRLHRYLTDIGVNPWMPVIPDAVAWTVVPEQPAQIHAARRRWQRGLLTALRGSTGMLLNPEFGAFGMVALPYFWLGIVVAPVLELVGYALLVAGIATGSVGSALGVAYLAGVVGYGMLLSVWTVVLEAVANRRLTRRDVARLLGYAIAESIGYRQCIAWYRASALLGERSPPAPRPHGQPSPAGLA